MKVNPNEPTFHYQTEENCNLTGITAGAVSSIPIRLELASRLLTGNSQGQLHCTDAFPYWCKQALLLAGTLIRVHNETTDGD